MKDSLIMMMHQEMMLRSILSVEKTRGDMEEMHANALKHKLRRKQQQRDTALENAIWNARRKRENF